MYGRGRGYGPRGRRPLMRPGWGWGRPMWRRPMWGWGVRRGPGCCGLFVLLFAAVGLLALLRVPLLFR